jgi:MoaA/NifB/PqqE/SkfB family radical SAM enzyme
VNKAIRPNQILRLLFWETTIKCNLTCAHCRRLESDEAAFKDLSTAQAKNLIEQLAELGRAQPVMPVLVFSGGEPLCRDDLFELVGQARAAGITPALATNGTLIDAAVAEQIRDSGIVRIAVSLDGATAEVHNKLRQLEGSFERALEGIKHQAQCRTIRGSLRACQINRGDSCPYIYAGSGRVRAGPCRNGYALTRAI